MSFFLSLALIASLPLQFAFPFPGGFDLPLARGLAVSIIIVFVLERLMKREWTFSSPVFMGLLASFLLWVVASLLWVSRLDLAFPKIIFIFNLFPLFFIWQYQFRSEKRMKQGLWALLWGATAAATLGLAIFFSQFVFGTSETFHFLIGNILPFFLGRELATMVAEYPSLLVNIGGETWLRTTAVFPDPHVAAFFFGLSGFLALGAARLESTSKCLALSIAAILFFADILTFSRGGYMGLIVGAVTYGVAARRQPWPALQRHLPLLIGVLFIALILSPPVLSRFSTSFTLEDASSTERITLWEGAVSAITEKPVFGTGIGNYLNFYYPLAAEATPFYAHNLFLDVAVELGLVGLTFFLGWILFGLVQSVICLKSHPLSPAILAGLSTYLAHSVFETALFSLHVSLLLIFILALIPSLKRQELVQ